MISLQVDAKQLIELQKLIGDSPKKVRRQINIAINKTARLSKGVVAKSVSDRVKITQKVVKQFITTRNASPDPNKINSASVRLRPSVRIPMRDFGARQTEKGVSYQIDRKGGRPVLPGAFQGPKPGVIKASWRGRVFARVGKTRLPIVQLFGPSAWGVFVVGKSHLVARKDIREILNKQVQARIQFITFKKTGV